MMRVSGLRTVANECSVWKTSIRLKNDSGIIQLGLKWCIGEQFSIGDGPNLP